MKKESIIVVVLIIILIVFGYFLLEDKTVIVDEPIPSAGPSPKIKIPEMSNICYEDGIEVACKG